MSQENLELVREAQDAWNRGETVVRGDVWHPDVEFLPLRSATEGGYHGLSGVEAFVADTLAVFEKFEMNYEYADLGDRVLAWGDIHLRARGSGLETDIETGGLFDFRDSGLETDIETGGLFDFRDGKIMRWEDFGSKERALEAAGLAE